MFNTEQPSTPEKQGFSRVEDQEILVKFITLNFSRESEQNERQLLITCQPIDKQIFIRELQQINDFKTRLLYSVSHEFKTPLNCSILLLNFALDNEQIQENLKQDLLEPALLNNLLLLYTTNDIIDFSQIELGNFQFNFQPFLIRTAISDCIEMVSFNAKQKSVELHFSYSPEVPQIINSDEQRFKQILVNLLNNAVKFTSEGYITVQLRAYEDGPLSDLFQISVEDTGCGIEKQKTCEILEAFGQNYKKALFGLNTKGGGLGLTISNYLAKGLGRNHRIVVKSKVHTGSTFSFLIQNNQLNKRESIFSKRETSTQKQTSFKWKSLSILSQEQTTLSQNPQMLGKLKIPPQKSIFTEQIKESLDIIDEENCSNDFDDEHNFPQNGSLTEAFTKRSPRNIIEIDSFSMQRSQKLRKATKENLKLLIQMSQSQTTCDCNQILLVDDNNFNLYSLEIILKDYGFRVTKADSGFKALEIVQDRISLNHCCQSFPLILMDLDMPGKDGYQTTKEILELLNPIGQESYICACSAYDGIDEKLKAEEVGMNNFISKPPSKTKLEEVINEVFLK